MARIDKTVLPALTLVAGQMPAPGAAPYWSDDDGTGGVEVQASLDLGTVTADVDTVVEAVAPGEPGNILKIALAPDGVVGAVAVTTAQNPDDGAGIIYTFHYLPGTSKVSDLETAIGTTARLAVKTPGTAAHDLDVLAATSLAGGAGGLGHGTEGRFIDEAVVTIVVDDFDGLTGIEVVAERKNTAGPGGGTWGRIEPPAQPVGADWDLTGGILALKNTWPTGAGISVSIPVSAPKRFRVGLRAVGNGAKAAAAARVVSIDFIQRYLYA